MASKVSALEARMGAAPVKALWSSPCKSSALSLRTTTSHPQPFSAVSSPIVCY